MNKLRKSILKVVKANVKLEKAEYIYSKIPNEINRLRMIKASDKYRKLEVKFINSFGKDEDIETSAKLCYMWLKSLEKIQD